MGSAVRGVPHERGPAVTADREVRAGQILRVPHTDGLLGEDDLYAVVTLGTAVAGLEPGEYLVGALADRWGTEPYPPGGKTIWVDVIPRPGSGTDTTFR